MRVSANRPWLVTGAAGFLGSHVVELLLQQRRPVIALDNLSWGQLRHLSDWEQLSALRMVIADIRDSTALCKLMTAVQPTAVIHLAALHYIPAAEADPPLAMDINVRGTQAVLSAAEAAGVERFWFASTGDVYAPAEVPHQEEHALAPFNVYGLSKWAGERLVELAARRHPERTYVIGRLFNLYGPRETNPHILPEVLKQLRAAPSAPLRLGNLWPLRDFVPVREAARAVVESLSQAPAGLSTVNLGTGVAHSMADLLAALGDVLGCRLATETDPAKIRPVERPHLQADVRRLRSLIGWVPHADLHRGLEELVAAEGLVS